MTSHGLILAVRKHLMPGSFGVSGFHPLDSDEIGSLLMSAGLWLGPRAELEVDESFRQLIPYIVLVRNSEVLCYRRAPSGGERRLHGLLSIGLGGHIDFSDVKVEREHVHLEKTLLTAAQREIAEEVGTVDVLARRWVGLLVDDDTPVGRVHLGIAGIWVVADAGVRAAEDALCEVQHVSIEALHLVGSELETWSAMLVPCLKSLVECARTM